MLTKTQIRMILGELAYETVYEDPGLSGVRLQRKHLGYSPEKDLSTVQATLSVMLEAAREATP